MSTQLRILLASLIGLLAQAQTPVKPVDGPPAPTRLQAMEQIYLNNLKVVQSPILKQYITDLNALLLRSPAADAPAINAEIARAQKMLANGAIEFFNAKPAGPPTKAEAASGIVFTLDPDEATPPQPVDQSVPIGQASWMLSRLPAGDYEFIAHYSCSKLPDSAVIKIDFNGQSFKRELKSTNVTKDDQTFRVLRLCQLKLKEDAIMGKVAVSSSVPGEPWMHIKQILIVKAKKAE